MIRESVERDFLRLDIFYTTTTTDLVEEVAKYATPYATLSTVGGVLSLYLGITLVSMFEVVELVVRVANRIIR